MHYAVLHARRAAQLHTHDALLLDSNKRVLSLSVLPHKLFRSRRRHLLAPTVPKHSLRNQRTQCAIIPPALLNRWTRPCRGITMQLISLTSCLLITSLLTSCTDGLNFLVVSPITTPSHSNFFRPVVHELSRKGHKVTYWNGLKPDNDAKSPNLRQLYSERLAPLNDDHQVSFNDRNHPYLLFLTFYRRTINYCTAIYQDPVFHQLMTTDEHYDLIVIEGVLNECVLPLVHALKTPFVYMVGIAPTVWMLDAIGSPQSYDHFPLPGLCFTDEMSLLQRTMNAVLGTAALQFRNLVLMSTVDQLASRMLRDYDTNVTSVRQIEADYLSLLITNTHPSINYGIPRAPALIEAGGLHCRPSRSLPQELEDFIDGAGDAGFIVVSFGSILRGSNMPREIHRAFIAAFSRLGQRVIWKWENGPKETNQHSNATIPENVMLLSWLPQQDLLGHPKARLFITHGGLFSNQEAVYHSVPLIALPVFADQPINAQKIHNDGYGIRLDWDDLTEEVLFNAIQTILTNPAYRARIQEVSKRMKDQIVQPLDRAVYWLEYVSRHHGAHHLRTAARKLSFFQRDLADVVLLICSICALVTYLIIRVAIKVFDFIHKRHNQIVISSKKNQ